MGVHNEQWERRKVLIVQGSSQFNLAFLHDLCPLAINRVPGNVGAMIMCWTHRNSCTDTDVTSLDKQDQMIDMKELLETISIDIDVLFVF